jgi:hypothetical protein
MVDCCPWVAIDPDTNGAGLFKKIVKAFEAPTPDVIGLFA